MAKVWRRKRYKDRALAIRSASRTLCRYRTWTEAGPVRVYCPELRQPLSSGYRLDAVSETGSGPAFQIRISQVTTEAQSHLSAAMGVQPEALSLHIQRSQPRLTKSPRGLTKRPSFRRSKSLPIKLPENVLALKQKILDTHPAKLTRFSLSHMRHMAIPPVLIPDSLNDRRAMWTLVSGKTVPLTMNMWENCKRRNKHLDMIDEYVTYR